MAIPKTVFPDGPFLPYRWARRRIQNGDVLLCSGSGIFSTMIQEATGSVWSHVGFILRLDEIDRIMVLFHQNPWKGLGKTGNSSVLNTYTAVTGR